MAGEDPASSGLTKARTGKLTSEHESQTAPALIDRFSGEILYEAELKARYDEYVDELHAEMPDTAACSYRHWLRDELGETITESTGELNDD